MSDNILKTFSPANPHFSKIVLTRNLLDRKIKIPKEFMRKYGETLSSPVILKLPSGLEWKVELTSCNGVVWLQKGWPEFVDHLSIRRGHLLLFRFEGNSRFHVIILDTSTTEIDYPTNLTHLHNSNYIKIDDEDDQLQEPKRELEVENDIDYVLISDEEDLPPFPKTGKSSTSQCPRPQKRMRTTSRSGLKALSANERARACDSIRAFKSENPFFWVIIEPSYISLVSLHVPKKFAETYINKHEVDFSLRVMDGRSWFVHYKIFKKLNKRGTYDNSAEIINPGWRAFVKDNNVEVGDVCIFELISNIGNYTSVFLVTINRRANHYQSLEKSSNGGKVTGRRSGRPPSSGAPRTRNAFEARGNRNFSFQVAVRKSHMNHSTVPVPIDIVRSHLEKKIGQYLKLMVGNRWWDVRLVGCTNPTKYVLSKGWRAFSRHNHLRPGDVCRFQMIHHSKPSELLVSIERACI